MGIRITTDDYGVKVWRSDKFGFPQYACTISTKTQNGERVNVYKELQFRRGVELQNGEEIYIQDGFPTLRTWTDKKTGQENSKEVWMITEFTYRARYEQETPKPIAKQEPAPKKSVQSSFDDLPDSFSAAEDDIPF